VALGRPFGKALWEGPLGRPFGKALWEGPLGRPFGKALWEGSLRRPFGKALWERTEPFWQFDEIDMSECRFVRYVDLCGMIGKCILNVSTGADSEYGSHK
jgi:hypothetical protein